MAGTHGAFGHGGIGVAVSQMLIEEWRTQAAQLREELGRTGEEIFCEILSDKRYRNVELTSETDRYHPFDICAVSPAGWKAWFDVTVGPGTRVRGAAKEFGQKLDGVWLNLSGTGAEHKRAFIERRWATDASERFFVSALFYGLNGKSHGRVVEICSPILLAGSKWQKNMEAEMQVPLLPGQTARLRQIAQQLAETYANINDAEGSLQPGLF